MFIIRSVMTPDLDLPPQDPPWTLSAGFAEGIRVACWKWANQSPSPPSLERERPPWSTGGLARMLGRTPAYAGA